MKTWCSKVVIVGMAIMGVAMMFPLSVGHSAVGTIPAPCPEVALAKKVCDDQHEYCLLKYAGSPQQIGCADQVIKCYKATDMVCQSTCGVALKKANNALLHTLCRPHHHPV